ncbi:MAG: HAMP domain-containing sensor histidine kinase [Lachnospiraceae bacterium]|nr:HAMP domain-containing sensor histidine kinase [Lachnospiraceae bacterium]
MKHSIKYKMALSFITLITATLIMIGILNYAFSEQYYMDKKQDIMEESWNMINEIGTESKAPGASFYHFCSNNNLYFAAMDDQLTLLWTNSQEPNLLINRIFGYNFMKDNKNQETIRKTDKYILQKTYDAAVQIDYLELWGKTSNGSYYIVRCPVESIKEASAISNQFYLMIGIPMILVGALVIWILTKRMVKPLQQLSEISKSMAQLDFDVKYKGKNHDEISVLGNNLNIMSEKLQNTITELKTANLELQDDIEKKIQVDEMRKEFLSNVTHELKTPIALIQGYAEGLNDNINEDEESRAFYCEVIMDEAMKMNKMVKKLLNLNQIEFGNDQVMMERFDLTELIQGVLQSSRILIEQKEAQILYEPGGPVSVWGDEFKIEEVVTNYLTNALNHLNDEKKIEITCKEEHGIVTTTVFNTGDPIPEEDIDKVWIKFYKVDKARTREYGGSGIGLSIVKAIMDSMHQKCGGQNYENGVAFWFTLESK